MSVPQEESDPIERLKDGHRRALEAHRQKQAALEEMGLLLYASRTADDPAIARGMAFMAEHLDTGDVPPSEALSRDEFLARGEGQDQSR